MKEGYLPETLRQIVQSLGLLKVSTKETAEAITTFVRNIVENPLGFGGDGVVEKETLDNSKVIITYEDGELTNILWSYYDQSIEWSLYALVSKRGHSEGSRILLRNDWIVSIRGALTSALTM